MSKVKMDAKTRKIAGKAVYNVLKPTYFTEIPINIIGDALKENGIVMLQEDNTEWSGIFCGEQGQCIIILADEKSKYEKDGIEFYIPYDNVGLSLSWYKCNDRSTRKIEVIGYVW